VSYALFRQTIESQFATAWDEETPIRWENVEFTVEGNEFVEFELSPEQAEQVTINANPTIREDGAIRVTVFVRQNVGTARAEALADIVRGALQRKALANGVQTYATSRLPAQTVELESGAGWYVVPTETRYHADYADS
jgi:hypothetical protein